MVREDRDRVDWDRTAGCGLTSGITTCACHESSLEVLMSTTAHPFHHSTNRGRHRRPKKHASSQRITSVSVALGGVPGRLCLVAQTLPTSAAAFANFDDMRWHACCSSMFHANHTTNFRAQRFLSVSRPVARRVHELGDEERTRLCARTLDRANRRDTERALAHRCDVLLAQRDELLVGRAVLQHALCASEQSLSV